MYAVGQPLHAYDADLFPQVNGRWNFGVRFANEGEEISLLAEGTKTEDRTVYLNGSELLVVDNSTGTPVGLAGVKGGRFAGVHADTKNIIIEAANFHPTITRKTARRLGIVIDASKRFENALSPELPAFAQRDIVKLIIEIAGGSYEGTFDDYDIHQSAVVTKVKFAHVNRLLGLDLENDEIISYIKRTGAKIIESDTTSFVAEAPFERTDLNEEADYIEEVGRIHGLLEIDSIAPEKQRVKAINLKQYYGDVIRQVLIKLGYSEVITSSFQKKGNLQLKNALASDKSYLRDSLKKNITKVLDNNHPHIDLLGQTEVKVFEIGTVFLPGEKTVEEKTVLCIGSRLKGNGYSPKDDVVVETACNDVEKVLPVDLVWDKDKGVAELDLSALWESLPVPDSYQEVSKTHSVQYQTISQFPAIARDIALWVNENEEANQVIETLVKSAGDMCVRHTLFDTFTKEGRTSYAFRLVFQSNHRTLTDTEVNEIMESLYKVSAQLGWEVR